MIEFDDVLFNENTIVAIWIGRYSTYPDVPSYMNCANLEKVTSYCLMCKTINGVDITLKKFDDLEEASSCYLLLKEKLNEN